MTLGPLCFVNLLPRSGLLKAYLWNRDPGQHWPFEIGNFFLEYVSIAVPRRPFIPRPPKSESANKAPGVKAKAKAAVKAKAKGAQRQPIRII